MAKKGKVKLKLENEQDERPIRWRRYEYLFLIVCEDEKTEPLYFESFREQIPKDKIFLKPVGTGRNSLGVVEKAIEERKKLALEAKKQVDETWAVFDKDDLDQVPANATRFETAFTKAEENNIKVAYSNEVFELWLLLHLIEVDAKTPLPRLVIYQRLGENISKLKKYAKFVYNHRKPDPNLLDIINEIGDESNAIIRAKQLLKEHDGLKHSPINANPSTKVHLLVTSLRGWIEYYNYTP